MARSILPRIERDARRDDFARIAENFVDCGEKSPVGKNFVGTRHGGRRRSIIRRGTRTLGNNFRRRRNSIGDNRRGKRQPSRRDGAIGGTTRTKLFDGEKNSRRNVLSCVRADGGVRGGDNSNQRDFARVR